MEPKKPDLISNETDEGMSDSQEPEIYAIKRERSGWKLSRRDIFHVAAATASLAAMPGRVEAQKCQTGTISHNGDVNCVRISSDGRMLASGGNDNNIKLWLLPSGALQSTLQGHSNWVASVR
jgi:WD40 repeat protein